MTMILACQDDFELQVIKKIEHSNLKVYVKKSEGIYRFPVLEYDESFSHLFSTFSIKIILFTFIHTLYFNFFFLNYNKILSFLIYPRLPYEFNKSFISSCYFLKYMFRLWCGSNSYPNFILLRFGIFVYYTSPNAPYMLGCEMLWLVSEPRFVFGLYLGSI